MTTRRDCDSPSPTVNGRDRRVVLGAALIVLATLLAYARSFSGAMVFDDASAIAENPTIRQLWPLGPVLVPPAEGGGTVGGRPLLNLSLALNYAVGGSSVVGYHVVNLLIHVGAALLVFGIVRRTALMPRWERRWAGEAHAMTTTIALLWALHPLQTESVAYIVQRAESLMGFCYLLTIYAFLRSIASTRPIVWQVTAVLACAAGMGAKEVMITAPVIVFLFDRTFVAGDFGTAWRRRKGLHLALASTWVLLGLLIATTGGNRGGTKGFGLGFAWWEFPATQFRAVAHYVRLAVWPHPLAFEYERFWVHSFAEIFPFALFLVPLAAWCLWSLARRPVGGFLGVWFFGILAPSSLAPGASQMIAEHRMYLPLAALVAAGVLVLRRWVGPGSYLCLGLIAVAGGLLTARRVEDYRTPVALWTDTVSKRPSNGVAHGQLASALLESGDIEPALSHFREAIRLELGSERAGQRTLLAEIEVNYGNALLAADRADDAATAYLSAIEHDPEQKLAHFNLGSVRLSQNRLPEAAASLEAALALDPRFAAAQTNYASLLLRRGEISSALEHYEIVLRLQPDSARAEANVGNALMQVGRGVDAIRHLQRAVELDPSLGAAEEFLGDALSQSGRAKEAQTHYENALRLDPNNADLRRRLEAVGRVRE